MLIYSNLLTMSTISINTTVSQHGLFRSVLMESPGTDTFFIVVNNKATVVLGKQIYFKLSNV